MTSREIGIVTLLFRFFAGFIIMAIKNYQKRALIKFMDGTCEICHKQFEEKDLHIHRINRGYNNGAYDCFRNLMVVCKKDHQKLHQNEFNSNRK